MRKARGRGRSRRKNAPFNPTEQPVNTCLNISERGKQSRHAWSLGVTRSDSESRPRLKRLGFSFNYPPAWRRCVNPLGKGISFPP